MAPLPFSLRIAIWLVVSLWVIGALPFYFGDHSELIWFVLFLGAGVAIAEWRSNRNTQKNENEGGEDA
jgi:hypothetical protein